MRKIVIAFFICCGCAVLAQERYTLSTESFLTIVGSSTVHDWEVTANSIKGNLAITNQAISELQVEVAVAEIKSERGPTMDNKMHAALKMEEHPTIVFKLQHSSQKDVSIQKLTIAGVERVLDRQIKFTNEDGKISISGAQEILLQDYEMEAPTAMFGQIVVGDMVTVNYNLIFSKE